MHRTVPIIVLILVLAPRAGGDERLKPREGVVLLTNGQLIAGTIIAAGDRYDVHLPNGEISLRKSEVAMVCASSQECYQRKRSGIEVGRVQDHLDLAEWCLKQELLAEGETELAAARQADATHPKIRLLEARLKLARQPSNREPVRATPTSTAPMPMDSLAKGLPPGAMEHFTNTVQPLLMNYCSKGGCHSGRGNQAMTLERISPRQSGRLATQRNLQRVLTMIDRDKPAESKLLTAPIREHGTAKAPIFTGREQVQYKQLVEWVYAVANARRPAPSKLEEKTAPLLQNMPGHVLPPKPAEAAGDPAPPVEAGEPHPIPPSSADSAFTREQLKERGLLRAALSDAPKGRVEAAPQFVPKDPFDPEIFNRRFFDE